MCFRVTKTSGQGAPPDPRKTSARHKEAARHSPAPEARPEPDGAAAARDHRVPSLRADAEQPGGQLVGERVLRRPEAALDTLPGRDCWLGVTPERRGGWACPAPSTPMPIEACLDRGSLPATSEERGSASALCWTWRNRKLASGMDGRGRVRPNGDVVSGDPQSEPDTQESPPAPTSGDHRFGGRGPEFDEPPGVVPETPNPECDGYERACGRSASAHGTCRVRHANRGTWRHRGGRWP